MTAVHVPLPVQGPLDTNGPVSSREPGTLVEATDVNVLLWGPRSCFTERSWLYRAPSGYFPDPSTPIFDGTNGFGSVSMRAKQQVNLGTKWTLDIVFRPTTVTHSSDATVPILQWYLSSFEAIGLYMNAGGAASGDQRKLVATVTPTSSPGVAGTTTTLTGVTQLAVGTAIEDTHHVRLVRDRTNLTMTCDGVSEATSTAVSATQRHEAATAVTTASTCYIGTASGLTLGANHLFRGRILRACLRAGAATDVTKGWRDFAFPYAQGVRFALHGKTHNSVGQVENSPFTSPLTWSGMTYDAVTESAPWYSTPVNAGAYFVDYLGRAWDVVAAGGNLYARRVG